MTWTAFIQSMKTGLMNRAQQAAKRANPPIAAGSRAASTQTVTAGDKVREHIKKHPMETWDFYVLDVSEVGREKINNYMTSSCPHQHFDSATALICFAPIFTGIW
jgi:hypothetical protein